jgi:hypothetical protein
MNNEPVIVTEYRHRASEWLDAHVPAVIGDANALLVSQGRVRADNHYSGCGDLPPAMYEALGFQHPNINRDNPATSANEWRVGFNVSLLAGWAGAARRAPFESEWPLLDAGDVLIQWPARDPNNAHVIVVVAPVCSGHIISIAEHGQRIPEAGGRVRVGRVRVLDLRSPGRPLQRWLPLPAVMRTCGLLGGA